MKKTAMRSLVAVVALIIGDVRARVDPCLALVRNTGDDADDHYNIIATGIGAATSGKFVEGDGKCFFGPTRDDESTPRFQ